jgi:hypothetical protein
MTKRMVFALALVALPLLWGCSKPPEAEMQKATASMQAARAAEAEQYAPQALTTAQDTLNAAMSLKQEQDSKFALFRSYGKAKAMYMRADVLAQKAATDAAAEKEKVKAQVTEMLTKARTDIDDAKAQVDKAPKGKGAEDKAAIEMMKNQITSINAAYDEANSDFQNGKYLTARTKLEQIETQVQGVVGQVQEAIAKKMGKAPAAK